MDSVKSKKSKTPKSAKKNNKSLNQTPVSKNVSNIDTPRPVSVPKKANGLHIQTPNKKGNSTPINKTPKTDSKKKKTPAKKVEEDSEDDDEEDDSEIELNPEIMKKLSEIEESMDEDEEDDDDEDDDDDDEDEDDEEESLDEDELKQLIQSLKEKKSKKTTEAPEAVAKGKKGTAAVTAKKENKKEAAKPAKKEAAKPDKKAAKKATAPATEAVVTIDKDDYLKSVKERDSRTLFVNELPIDVTEETIMQLSKDIQSTRIRKRARRDQAKNLCYAFLEFESEATAEKNFKVLSASKINGKSLTVDYTGDKSLHQSRRPAVIKELDPSKLYITGFPYTTTDIELKQLMPKAETVVIPIKRATSRPLGFAFAKFTSSEICTAELKRLNGKIFKDCKLVVLHANLITRTPLTKGTKRKTDDVKGKAKKIKLDKSKKVEEDDDDDDDEEEDEDEEDEEDDDSDEE